MATIGMPSRWASATAIFSLRGSMMKTAAGKLSMLLMPISAFSSFSRSRSSSSASFLGRRSNSPASFISSILDRKSTRLNSSHGSISYAVFCLQKKITINRLAYELRLLRQLQPLHRTIRHLRRAKRHALPACLFEDARHPRVNHLVVADVVVDG